MINVIGTMDRIYVSYPDLHSDVKPGNCIMIDDGKIEVRVTEIAPNNDVKVVVVIGGIISSKKGI
jgi:pyruvate kinase